MTLPLFILCMAAAGVVAYATSGAVALGLLVGRRWLERRTPAAQARLWLGLSLAPAFVTLVVMGAALAPTFGWIADHCETVGMIHAHPHICGHYEGALPALSLVVLAVLFPSRWLLGVARMLRLGRAASASAHALLREAAPNLIRGALVLPIERPQAFVLGTLRPRLFLTQGLMSPRHRSHLATVLAHERAHLRRRDSLRRLVASLALPFHLPKIAGVLERGLGRAHEMAADEEAARTVGSRPRVAEALLHLARFNGPLPPCSLGFGCSEIELRVRSLLERPSGNHGPQAHTLLIIAAAGALAIAGGAEAVHHGVELALGLLG